MQSELNTSQELTSGDEVLCRRHPRVEEKDRDAKLPLLISRGSNYYPEAVEKDMKRGTPTTPGSSSSSAFPPSGATPTTLNSAFPITADHDKGAPPRSLTLDDFKSRAPHLVDKGGGGGGAAPPGGGSGVSEGGGGSSEGGASSGVTVGGGVSGPGHGQVPSSVPSQGVGSEGVVMVPLVKGEHGGSVMGQKESSGVTQEHDGGLNSWRSSAQPTNSGQVGSNVGMGYNAGARLTTLATSNIGAGYPEGVRTSSYLGQSSHPSGPTFVGGSMGQRSEQAAGMPSRYRTYQRSYSAPRVGTSHNSRSFQTSMPPPFHPHSNLPPADFASERPAGYPPQAIPPPSYQSHPQHSQQIQAPPPSATIHPPRHYPVQTHHQNPPMPSSLREYRQNELCTQPHTLQYGSSVAGGWGQYLNMPHSLSSSDSYASPLVGGESGSDTFSQQPGVQYHRLGSSSSERSRSPLLGSYSQPSSLSTLSSEDGRYPYGPQSGVGSLGMAGYMGSGGDEERCHSFPLTQQVLNHSAYHRIPDEDIAGPQGGGQQLPHPQTLQQWDVPHPQQPWEAGAHHPLPQPSVTSNRSQTPPSGESLAKQLNQTLVLTESTPAGQSEGEGQRAKHDLLTQLDSDRLQILEQPQDTVVRLHDKAVLTCRAIVTDADMKGARPRQQWYKGEDPLVKEESSELVFGKVEKRDIGLYYCVFTHPEDSSAKKCSQVAQLKIGEPEVAKNDPEVPVIIEQPPRRILAVVGEDLTLTLKVKGEQPLRWYRDTEELDYCKGAELFIPRAAYSDSGQYCCSVTNRHGSQLSKSFHVQVSRVKNDSTKGLSQNQRPASLHSYWEGQSVSDSFLQEVSKAISHQVTNWQKLVTYLGLSHSDLLEVRAQRGVSVSGEEQCLWLLRRWRERYSERRALLKMRLTNAGVNLDVFMDSMPGGQVQGVEHMIVEKPRICVHPQSLQVMYGQDFSLSVGVASPAPHQQHHCTFQWYHNYLRLQGKTQPCLFVKSALDSDAGEYYCVVANAGGTSDSEIAFVKVLNPNCRGSGNIPPTAAIPMPDSMASRHLSFTGQGVGPAGRTSSGLPAPPMSLPANRIKARDDLIGRGYHPRESRPMSWAGGTEGMMRISARRGSGGVALPMDPALGMSEKPRIIEHPQSQKVDAGDPLTLRCRAVGSQGEPVTYLWYFNGLSLQQEVRPEYFINFFTDEDEGLYFCKVSSSGGEVDSSMAHVQMKDDD